MTIRGGNKGEKEIFIIFIQIMEQSFLVLMLRRDLNWIATKLIKSFQVKEVE
jgi:hypothetical protein